MGNTVDVIIPVEAEAAEALTTQAQRVAAGQYLSDFLRRGNLLVELAQAIREAKAEAHANGLTDEIVDAELEAWRAERTA